MSRLIVTDTVSGDAFLKLSTNVRGGLLLQQYSLEAVKRMIRDPQFDTVELRFNNKEVGKWTQNIMQTNITIWNGDGYPINDNDVFVWVTPLNNSFHLTRNEVNNMFYNNELVFQLVKVDDGNVEIDSVNLAFAETTTVVEDDEVDEILGVADSTYRNYGYY